MTFRIVMYGAVWAVLIALIWSWVSSVTTTTTAPENLVGGGGSEETLHNNPTNPVRGGGGSSNNKPTNEAGVEGIVAVVGTLQHLWRGEIQPITAGWLLSGGASMAYRGVAASARYVLGNLLWDKIVPSVQALGLRVIKSASAATTTTAATKPFRHGGDGGGDSAASSDAPGCNIPCAISGTDCPNDAPCLCRWADVQWPGWPTGEGYATVWRPCFHLVTRKRMGRCMCGRGRAPAPPPPPPPNE